MMMVVMTSVAWAEGPGGGGSTSSSLLSLVPFVLIFVIFYFLLILPQQKRQKQQKAMLDFAVKVAFAAQDIGEADFAVLKSHGFSEEDGWDIAAIAAFFAMSNRLANATAMRPNDEFYLMGRVAKPQ